MLFVQEMNAGFENEFFLLKSILRYEILPYLGKFVTWTFYTNFDLWYTNKKLVQGWERRMGAI